jgi:hypothetical protein
MSSDISYRGQYFWVANRRLSTLIAFALEVGKRTVGSQEEIEFVQRLRQENHEVLFPGCGFDLEERFPSVTAKKFWARVFFDVARDVFLRRLGNHEIDFWQASAICDAVLVARLLTCAVREAEPQWFPHSKDVQAAEEFEIGRLNVQL